MRRQLPALVAVSIVVLVVAGALASESQQVDCESNRCTFLSLVIKSNFTTSVPGGIATPTLPTPSFDNCQEDPNPAGAPNFPIKIVTVLKSASPEVVRLQNVSTGPVNLGEWHMCSITGNQEHLPISGTLVAGEIRDFPNSGGPIWNNSERDDGALYNAAGQLVSYWIDQ